MEKTGNWIFKTIPPMKNCR